MHDSYSYVLMSSVENTSENLIELYIVPLHDLSVHTRHDHAVKLE